MTHDHRQTARLITTAERDLHRALRTLQVAQAGNSDDQMLRSLVARVTDAVRAAKTTSGMLLRSADASEEAAAAAKRAAKRATKTTKRTTKR